MHFKRAGAGEEEKMGLKLLILVVGIGIIIAATGCLHPSEVTEEKIDWNLTLIGDCEKVLLYDEIKKMPSYEGYGGFFTTVGITNGPFNCRGVPIEELCNLVGGINASNTLWEIGRAHV